MFTCSCGCELFEQITPFKIEEGFRIWSIHDKLIPFAKSIPMIMCIKCFKAYLPSTSLTGKNSLDPEVKLYKELIDSVEQRNSKINRFKDMLDYFEETKEEITFLIESIKSTDVSTIEEVKDVKTAKSSRGPSKKNIS